MELDDLNKEIDQLRQELKEEEDEARLSADLIKTLQNIFDDQQSRLVHLQAKEEELN